jgi:hypothetical protein
MLELILFRVTPRHAQTLNVGFTLAYPIDYRSDSGRLVSRCHSAKALLSIPPTTLNPPQPKDLPKDSFQKGTTFGPQRCLN